MLESLSLEKTLGEFNKTLRTVDRSKISKMTVIDLSRKLLLGFGLLKFLGVVEIGTVGEENKNYECNKGDNGFPKVNIVRGVNLEHNKHPQVSNHRCCTSDSEHTQIKDLLWLRNGDDGDTTNDQKVEGG